MAFANLFTSLSTADDDASINRQERKLGKLEHYERDMEKDHAAKEGPLRSEQQSDSKNKTKRTKQNKSDRAKRAKTLEAPWSYRDYDGEAKDHHMVKCGYEQPSLDFNKELDVYCHGNHAEEAMKKENEYLQHKMKTCDSNQHSQSDRGGHSRGRHRTMYGRDSHFRGGGGASLDFNKELDVYCHGNHAEKAMKKENEYLQRKMKTCHSNQHSQSDRGGHSRVHHQGMYGRDFHFRGRGGGGASNCYKNVGRNRGRTVRGRGVPVKDDWPKIGGSRTDQMGRPEHFNQSVPGEQKRAMTQEFKDQNALEVDGRLICRHFVFGRCNKGDECQLEHAKDFHNDLIKEVCKFYVQGFCTKGESCPYMHKSFPCKFFHMRRKSCSQGAECRFSHEPLTDLNRPLLEAALKRDHDILEMAKKDHPVNSDQPENMEESLSMEDGMTPDNSTPVVDILLYPIRPNFYNSSCPPEPHTEKVTPGLANITKEDTVPLHATGSTPVHNPSSSHSTCKEPVSYSVEAVLRSQKPKPIPGVFTSPPSQESTGHSFQQRSLDCPSISAKLEEAPYSVDAVLGSRRTVEKSICGLSAGPITNDSCTPPAQTRPCTTMTGFGLREMPQPPTSLANHNGKVAYSADTVGESYKPLESNFKSLFAGSVAQIPGAQKPTERAFFNVCAASAGRTYSAIHHIKTIGHLPRGIAGPQDTIQPAKSTGPAVLLEDGRSKCLPKKSILGPFHNPFPSHLSRTTALQCPTQTKHLLPQSGLQASVGSPDPSLRFTDCNVGVAVPAENVSGSHEASVFLSPGTDECVLAEINRQIPRVPPGPRNDIQSPDPDPNSTFCESKMTLRVESAVGWHKRKSAWKLPSVQTKPDSNRTILCQESIDVTHSTLISTDCGGIPLKAVVEPSKASERPFIRLFASPISKSAGQLPSTQTKPDTPATTLHPRVSVQVADSTSSSRDCKEKNLNMKTSFKSLFAGLISKDLTDAPPAPWSLGSLPGSKSKKGMGLNSAEHINDSPRQLENPICSLFTDSICDTSTLPIHTDAKLDSSTTRGDRLLPDASSHQASSKTSTTKSILKTLFLRLSPCSLDEEQGNVQDGVYSEGENKDKNTTRSAIPEPQWKREKERIEGELRRRPFINPLGELREEIMQEPEICLLMDEPVEIPLEPSPRTSLCDPRHPLRLDVALLKPTFAHSVVWSVSDLVPLPPPSQHQSVVPEAQGSQELSTEKTIAPLNPAGHLQEAAGSELRAACLNNLPIQSMALSGQNECLEGNVGDKTLKDIFKTFDPTASPFGQ